jgi:hypothetical protein
MMTAAAKPESGTETEVRWLSDAEACAEFDGQARKWLGMSGDEFLRRWDEGEYRDTFDDEEHWGVLAVASLMPLVRP